MNNLKKPAFSIKEYERRLKAVQKEMDSKGLDILLCHNLASVCYLTGFQTLGSYGYGHYAAIVPLKGNPFIVTSDFESHNARIYSWVDDIVVYGCLPDYQGGPVDELAETIKKRGYGRARIGYETGHFSMTISEYLNLKTALPEAEFIDTTSLLDTVRIVKSDEEISVMRKAAKCTSRAMMAAVEATAEGSTDNDVAAEAFACAIKNGAEYFSLQPIVTSGKRSGIPHSTFRRNRLEKGDTVFVEVSASYERYSVPALRTISIGNPSCEVEKAFEACFNSVRHMLDNMKGGVNSRETAIEAGKKIKSIVPDLVWHGYYCYSVGLGFPPACGDCITMGFDVTEKYDLFLCPGMVFHCSTSLRKPGEYGVTFSETVLITENGCEVLNDIPQKLFIAGR